MACACKNKLKRLEKVTPEYTYSEQPIKKLLWSVLGIFGRILSAFIILALLPFGFLFVIYRVIFKPNQKMIINMDKFFRAWKNHTESKQT